MTISRSARGAAIAGLITAAVIAAMGCQSILGVEPRPTDPLPDGCTLPQSGGGQLRVADLVPSDDHVDFCVRAANGAWGRPVLRGGGTGAACQAGFAYTDVSVPFASPLGAVDVKAIPAGKTCSAAALSEADGISTFADHAVSVVRIGGAGQPEQLVALEDEQPPSNAEVAIRFMHAAVGVPSLAVGLAADARLPTEVTARLLNDPIKFGAIVAGASAVGRVEKGYLFMPGNEYRIGAATADDPKAILVTAVKRTDTILSLFAIGNNSDARYPVRGLVCAERAPSPDGLRAACKTTDLGTISVDVWNAGLYGAFAIEESSRRPYIMDAIKNRTSDVMCITEVTRKEDRDAMIAAATAGSFPYSVVGTTDLNTQPNDPRDATGATPTPPQSPPCGGSVPTQEVDDAYSCMVQQCNTKTDDSGTINGGSRCLSTNCATALFPLLTGSIDEKRCFDCVIANAVSYSSFAQNRLTCTTDPRPAFAFGAQTPSVILSRFKIVESETYVLPATTWRRVVHYAKLQTEPNKTVDFYCAQVAPLLGTTMPYVGPYAPLVNGSTNPKGWEQEQLLQAQRAAAYVKAKSGTNPAILVGDWASSVAASGSSGSDAGAPAVLDLNPDTINSLRAAFGGSEAVPASFAANPNCTRCPTSINPYNGQGTDMWNLRPYTLNMKPGSGVAATTLFKEPVVPLSTGAMGPLSDTYLFNVQILRP